MTKTQVINYGLIALGQRPLPNPEFLDTEEARIMNALYPIEREKIIAEVEWPCFIKNSLALNLLTNGEGDNYWTYTFALPPDLNRIISVIDVNGFELRDEKGDPYSPSQKPLWAIERDTLKYSSNPVYLKYLFNPNDTFVFPGYFGRALGMALAYGCAMRIGHDQKFHARLYQLAIAEKAQGVVEAMKGSMGVSLESHTWSEYR